MERISRLQFDVDGSWDWLPWAGALVVCVQAVRMVRSGESPRRLVRRGLLVLLALVIIAVTWRTGRLAGQLFCSALIVGHVGYWLWESYRSLVPGRSGTGRSVVMLRLLAVAGAMLLILRPVWAWQEIRFRRPVLAIAIDESRSMGVSDVVRPDSSERITRSQAVEEALVRSVSALHRLKQAYDVRRLRFGRRVVADPESLPEDARGYTALGDVISDIAARWSGLDVPLAGVVLISDGRNNLTIRHAPDRGAEILVQRNIPLWTIGVGPPEDQTDRVALSGQALRFPRRVSAETRFPIQAEFSATGLSGRAVTVDCYLGDRLIDSGTERITESPARIVSRFSCTAPRGGLYPLRVRASVDGIGIEETLTEYLAVEDERLRVLVLDRPRVEGGRIYRALSRSEALTVERRFIRAGSSAALSNDLRREDDPWAAYDVVVIGDVEPGGIRGPVARDLHQRVVEEGLGLLIVGGRLSLGKPAAEDNDVAALLPVGPGAVKQTTAPVRVVPTRTGWTHGVVALADHREDSDQRWSALGPLPGTYFFSDLKPAAEVLLATENGDPILVAHQVGKGRVALCGADQTWRWQLGSDQGNEMYRRFWRQLVEWLSNVQPDMLVVTDRSHYDLGRLDARQHGVEITVLVRGGVVGQDGGGPVPDLTVRGPEGETTKLTPVAEGTRFVSTHRPRKVGEYVVTAELAARGQEPVRRTAQFGVVQRDAEMADPRADLEQLRRLAELSRPVGGAYADLDGMDTLVGEIQQAGRPLRLERKASLRLVDRWKWWILAVMLTSLAAEWGLRKRAGFV